MEREVVRAPATPGHDGSIAAPTPRPGWHTPQPETVPEPTYWPAVMALGLVFLLWGTITTFILSGAGLLLVGLALAGWIGALRHER